MSEQPDNTSSTPSVPSARSPRRREPSLSPPEYVLTRHGGRVLDPTTAVRLRNQPSLRATVYVGGRLLLRGAAVVDDDVPRQLQPTARVRIGDLTRETLDPDNYVGGFGTWSGTSFSAPVVAGELADHIFRQGGLDACDAAAAVDRGWLAIKDVAPQVDRP